MTKERRDWGELCAAAAKEEDQSKLLDLMEELLAVLDKREYDCIEHSAKQRRITSHVVQAALLAHPELLGNEVGSSLFLSSETGSAERREVCISKDQGEKSPSPPPQ